MYPVGLVSSFHLLLSCLHSWSLPYSLAYSFISLVAVLCLSLRVKRPSKADTVPANLPGLRIFSILPFFGKRYDFLNQGFRVTGENIFQFKLLRVRLYFLKFNTLAHCARPTHRQLSHDPYKSRHFCSHLFLLPGTGHGRLWRKWQEGFLQCQRTGSPRRLQSPFGCSAYSHSPLLPTSCSTEARPCHSPCMCMLVFSSAAPVCDRHNL